MPLSSCLKFAWLDLQLIFFLCQRRLSKLLLICWKGWSTPISNYFWSVSLIPIPVNMNPGDVPAQFETQELQPTWQEGRKIFALNQEIVDPFIKMIHWLLSPFQLINWRQVLVTKFLETFLIHPNHFPLISVDAKHPCFNARAVFLLHREWCCLFVNMRL